MSMGQDHWYPSYVATLDVIEFPYSHTSDTCVTLLTHSLTHSSNLTPSKFANLESALQPSQERFFYSSKFANLENVYL